MSSRIPLGRWGEPEDLAKAVLFLASDDSSYINAIELMVDGGATGIRGEPPFFTNNLGARSVFVQLQSPHAGVALTLTGGDTLVINDTGTTESAASHSGSVAARPSLTATQ